MCDYSLQHVASRPAMVGDELMSTKFHNSITRGFADKKQTFKSYTRAADEGASSAGARTGNPFSVSGSCLRRCGTALGNGERAKESP